MSKIYTFSPSEFAFNYAGCKRCYYDQKVNKIVEDMYIFLIEQNLYC